MRRLALACVVLAACAARREARTAVPPPTADERPAIAAGPSSLDPHAQIDELAKQIDAQRDQLGLIVPVDTIEWPPATSMSAPVSSKTDPQCHPGASQTCQDSCGLSDSICDNAKKICDLAVQLPGDRYAAQKCDEGKATCDAAHGKCCGCQP